FFQAEDGIRDFHVTGVQTCALPICYPDIEHHGAKDGVTGSCHQLHMDASHSLLVDCGLFQGNETSSDGRAATERLDIEFSLATEIGRASCREWMWDRDVAVGSSEGV